MSAWYIFNAMGFYPVCPASNYYVIGSPGLERAVIHLSNGNTFTVTAKHLSKSNFYIQSVRLNDKEWNSPFLPYDELKDGGSLAFTMGSEPNKNWGVAASIPR
jgi:putative alpha-1,2-mannosidase